MTIYAGLDVSDKTPAPFRPAAIMKARTDRYQTPSDDLEDNHWHREKQYSGENQLDNGPDSPLLQVRSR